MKKFLYILFLTLCCILNGYAQTSTSNVLINVPTCSNTSSFTVSQPLIFCTADRQLYIYNGSTYVAYFPGGGGGNSVWVFQTKPTTETRTNTTTLTNDGSLQFAMVANKIYQARIVVIFSHLGTPDFKYAITGPASPVSIACWDEDFSSSTTKREFWESTYGVPHSILSTGGTGIVRYNCNFFNGVNAGTFAFQWAQDTSDAGATQVLAGSYIEYRQAN